MVPLAQPTPSPELNQTGPTTMHNGSAASSTSSSRGLNTRPGRRKRGDKSNKPRGKLKISETTEEMADAEHRWTRDHFRGFDDSDDRHERRRSSSAKRVSEMYQSEEFEDRYKRATNVEGEDIVNHRARVRPCRSICQTVEQRCPYFLPGDRAPAHPTQYAGEPTFLCLGKNTLSYLSQSIYNFIRFNLISRSLSAKFKGN